MANESLLFAQGPLDYQQANSLISLWAEVGWFLTPELDSNGNTLMTPTLTVNGVPISGLPLFTLRRRVRVVVPDDPAQITPVPTPVPITPGLNFANLVAGRVPATPLWGQRYAEVSCTPDGQTGFLYFNSTSDLTNPARQAMPPSLSVPLGSPTIQNSLGQMDGQASWFGDDIVLSDVISFNVRILAADSQTGNILLNPLTGQPDFIDVPTANANYNPVPPNPIYNTGNFLWLVNPPPFRILAVEISIRIWDLKTARSRQITIVQDM